MAAKVVTISVQLGSDGFTIARVLAEKLGFRYYDWEVTSRAAAEAGVSAEVVASAERVPSLVGRIVERFASGFYGAADAPDGPIGPASVMIDSALRTMTSDDYRRIIEQVVRDLGDQGDALIVGHFAQVVLRDRPDTLKLLVHGSEHVRASRLVVDEGMLAVDAMQTLKSSDHERTAFFKRVYKVDWLDSGLYDLTINTDHIDPEQAAELALKAALDYSHPGATATVRG